LALACWEASVQIVAWMAPVIVGLLLAGPLSWLMARPAGPLLRLLLSTPDCRCPPAIVESANRARSEWEVVAVPSSPDGLGHAPRAA
jgi:membrane glycosyltransferase